MSELNGPNFYGTLHMAFVAGKDKKVCPLTKIMWIFNLEEEKNTEKYVKIIIICRKKVI